MPASATSLTGQRGGDTVWPENPRARFALGVADSLPIVMGYVPIGLALGVLAAQAGLSTLETGAMSVFVYAGASQFIGVSMIASGLSPLTIALTTLLVNLRHMLMSAALSPYMKDVKRTEAAALSFFVTDESFAVSEAAFRRRGRADVMYMVGLYLTAYTSWVLATVAGAIVGSAFAVPEGLGLDFALPAMFIGLLAGQLRDHVGFIVAIVAAATALVAGAALGPWTVMVASVVAATIGVGVTRWNRTSSSRS